MTGARLALPAGLRGVFPDFHWDEGRLHARRAAVREVPLDGLLWHLDLPVWSTVPGEPRFDLRPHAVLLDPGAWPRHDRRIREARVALPLELLEYGGRNVLIDGYHRLCRLAREGRGTARVRVHADADPGSCPAGPPTSP